MVDLLDAGEGVDLLHGLVVADAEDAGEAEGEAAGVAVGAHDVVEGDFEDAEGFDGAEVAVVLEGVRGEPGGELGDFGVGDAGVGFADVEEGAGGVLNGEGVVAEEAGAAAVAELCAGDDDVEGSEFALELDPGEAAATGEIGGVCGLEHDALVGAGAGVGVGAVDFVGGLDEPGGGEHEARDGVGWGRGVEEGGLCVVVVGSGFEGRDEVGCEGLGEGFEAGAALAQGLGEEEIAGGSEEIEGHEDDGDVAAHGGIDALAADALAEGGEGQGFGGGEVPGEEFAVEDEGGGVGS